MTAKRISKPAKTVRHNSLDELPEAPPLSHPTKSMDDAEIERRDAADPDAGAVPPGFWSKAELIDPEGTQQITLRLPRPVVKHFKATGKGYQTPMSRVLASYVDAVKKTG